MKRMLLSMLAMGVSGAFCQLTIGSGATFVIQTGATVTVQGDVVSQSNIQGQGKLLMKGSAAQNLNMNNAEIQTVLEIDNANGVNVSGNTTLVNHLLFTNGKMNLTGAANFTLGDTSTFSGASTARYVVTNGTGSFRKRLASNATVTLPIGNDNYNPITVAVAGGSAFSGAFVSGIANKEKHPQQHPRTTDFLNTYWTVGRSGFTGGTMTLTGTYQNADLTGLEGPLESLVWNGSAWALGGANDEANNTVAATSSSANNVDLHGMNKFILVSPKVFLQGPLDGALMRDNLRSTAGPQAAGTPPTGNILPSTDPYRLAPLNTQFTHVNNSVAESAVPTIFNYQANAGNDIADWIFLELRNYTSGTTAPVVQTRSALLQRDGDIVDIDGISPVYFKDVNAGNFVLSVRHRNHLGLSTRPNAATLLALNLATSTVDFTTLATTSLYGSAPGNYVRTGGNINLLLAGDATRNGTSNYVSLGASDRSTLLTLMGNPGSAFSPSRSLTSSADYLNLGSGDFNFDRTINYVGLGTSDRSFLLSQVLGGSVSPTPTRSQILPGN